MVEYTCARCGKTFPKLWKLTRHNDRKLQCKLRLPIANTQASVPQIRNQGATLTPVPHVRGRDRRKEVPRKARSRSLSPGPSTQTNRENHSEVERQDAQEVSRKTRSRSPTPIPSEVE